MRLILSDFNSIFDRINQLAQNTQGEKTMQAAGKADEPGEAARPARLASLVHNYTVLNPF